MHLRIKILNDNVRKQWEQKEQDQFPAIANEFRDSGIDVPCPDDFHCTCGEVNMVGLGIAVEAQTVGEPFTPLAFYMYPRSSICKTPLRLANSVGIIDSGYRGELKAPLDCVTKTEYDIHMGDRLIQICAPDLSPITFELVNELSCTERGSGGIGSTGK